ncbi:MAG TPA: relaxase/mobilization nuclease domain-containing protein, partial [Puia sp.]|nr:relaxase/mobilization nuclease domain-containing protein [Puia sp.]
YMKEIGFENQPYLVYRHHDAGHPHCHIVTTHVRSNGDPIEMYNIGKIQSEQARLRIEKEYQLTTAEMKQQLRQQGSHPDGVQKITYGESSTTQSISRVLDHVTENYKYTNLKELNTVLRLYNVEAYRGREDSKLYQNRGLLYRVLDENGRYLGVPLKASFFDSKPTLDNLEKKMIQNQALKLKHQEHVAISVQWNIVKESHTMEEFKQAMARDKIRMVLHQDKQGICKDVFYIDLKNKCIYNGSELGERCNHLAIQKLIDRETTQKLEQSQNQNQTQRQTYRLRHHF